MQLSQVRRPESVRLLWPAWVLLSIAVTLPALAWHLTQFGKPGLLYEVLLASALAALGGFACIYHRIRLRIGCRYDIALVLLPALLICLVYEPLASACIPVLFASAWISGQWVLRRFDLQPGNPAAAIALPSLAGLGLLTMALLASASAGLYRIEFFLLLLLIPLAAGRRMIAQLLHTAREIQRSWTSAEGVRQGLLSVCIVFSSAFAALSAIVAITPVTAADALNAHLPLAASYLASHTLTPPESLNYGWFPQGFEVLLGLLSSFAGQAGARLLNPLFFALAILLAIAIAHEAGIPKAAIGIGSSLVLSAPFLHWTGSVVKNDLAMAAWQFAALYAVLRWHATRRFSWILLSAAFLGLAFQIKHVAMFGAVPLGLLWMYAVARQDNKVRAALLVAAAFTVFGLFSVARTYLATGNPVYPQGVEQVARTTSPRHGTPYLLVKLRVPWRIHFDGLRNFESSSPNPSGFALLFLLPLPLLAVRRPRTFARSAVMFFITIYLLYWLAIMSMVRYALPAIFLLVLFLGARLADLPDLPGIRRASLVAVVYVMTFGWVAALMIESYPALIPYLIHRIDASEYLRRSSQPYGAMEYLRRTAAAADEVLDIDGNALEYAHNPGRIHLLYREPHRYQPEEVVRFFLQHPDSRWIVLPNAPNGTALVTALERIRPLRHAYGDPLYSVYEVSRPR